MGFEIIVGHVFFVEIIIMRMITNIYTINRWYIIFIQLTWLIIEWEWFYFIVLVDMIREIDLLCNRLKSSLYKMLGKKN